MLSVNLVEGKMEIVPDKLLGSIIMHLDLEKVRIYAKKADNRSLLDRVTVFCQGMEPAAIEIIKKDEYIPKELVTLYRENKDVFHQNIDYNKVPKFLSKCFENY